jgi:hypothetical protein
MTSGSVHSGLDGGTLSMHIPDCDSTLTRAEPVPHSTSQIVLFSWVLRSSSGRSVYRKIPSHLSIRLVSLTR